MDTRHRTKTTKTIKHNIEMQKDDHHESHQQNEVNTWVREG